MKFTECQWIGPAQTDAPFHVCGRKPWPDRAYCEDHIWQVYQKGSSVGNRRKIAAIERELRDVKESEVQELDE